MTMRSQTVRRKSGILALSKSRSITTKDTKVDEVKTKKSCGIVLGVPARSNAGPLFQRDRRLNVSL